MSGIRIFRRLRDHLDMVFGTPSDGDVLTYDSGTDKFVLSAPSGGGGGGAPTTVDYLVGTASGDLSAEIVVGTSPGGELGGTWASPTVDATHSGSSHASVQAAAEATAASALSAHSSDTTSVHGIADTSALETTSGAQAKVDAHVSDASDAHDASAISIVDSGAYFTGTDVEAALQSLGVASPQIGAGVSLIRPLSGYYHVLCPGGGHAASASAGNNIYTVGTQWYLPFVFSEDQTIDRVGVACHSGGTAAVGRFSLYEDDGHGLATGVPIDFGTLTLASGANVVTVSQAILAGRVYHLAFAVNSHTATANIKYSRRTAHPGQVTNDINKTANDTTSGWYTTGVTGAPPSNPTLSLYTRAGAGDEALSSPTLFVRIA